MRIQLHNIFRTEAESKPVYDSGIFNLLDVELAPKSIFSDTLLTIFW
jgi:hypothetical protein